jgi:hypothetical protein
MPRYVLFPPFFFADNLTTVYFIKEKGEEGEEGKEGKEK